MVDFWETRARPLERSSVGTTEGFIDYDNIPRSVALGGVVGVGVDVLVLLDVGDEGVLLELFNGGLIERSSVTLYFYISYWLLYRYRSRYETHLELVKLVGVLDTDEAGVVTADKALVVESSGLGLMLLNLLDGNLGLQDDNVAVRDNIGSLVGDGEGSIGDRGSDDTRKGGGENRNVLEETDHFEKAERIKTKVERPIEVLEDCEGGDSDADEAAGWFFN